LNHVSDGDLELKKFVSFLQIAEDGPKIRRPSKTEQTEQTRHAITFATAKRTEEQKARSLCPKP